MDPKRNARKILPALVGALFASLGTTPVLAQSAPAELQNQAMAFADTSSGRVSSLICR